MSGFAGIIVGDGSEPPRDLLVHMAERFAFRGPDSTQVTVQPGAGFCFTFLKTGPAPQSPTQPFSIDGRLWLIGDVRLDARQDLRRELEQAGQEIVANVTDEELVLRAWQTWGAAGFSRLQGDLAFAIWDASSRQLFCFRDLMGARPFFYSRFAGNFYFSNTLDAIRCTPQISAELDSNFIADFLLQGWCQEPEKTAFRDIARLPAGHILKLSQGTVKIDRCSILPIEEPLRFKHTEEYVEPFRVLLKQAVCERLPDGSLASFLSGGLDSASVAATAVQCAGAKGGATQLRAYTVDYAPLFDDPEGRLAAVTAQTLGILHEIQSGASCLPFAGWKDDSLPMPEPCHEPLHLLYVEQNRRIAQHSRVAFSGYGGDDVLTGQSWPYLIYLLRRLKFGTLTRDFGGYLAKHGRIPPLRAGFRSRVHGWMNRASLPEEEYPRWFSPDFAAQFHLRDRWNTLQRSSERNSKPNHPLYPSAYATLNGGVFWPSVLENEDAAWSGVPVELRSPLLDVRLLRFLLRVPPVPLCLDKELLRRAMEDLLPDEIRLRPKTPLQGNPLVLHAENKAWSPQPFSKPPDALLRFIDWKTLNDVLASQYRPWIDLRPVTLAYWLSRIEKACSRH